MRRLWLIAILGACNTVPPDLPGPLAGAPRKALDRVLAPPLSGVIRAAILDVPASQAFQRLIHGPSACHGHLGVNPLAILAGKCHGPVVGVEFRILFVTSACPVPKEPDWTSWILVSTRPMPVPLDFTSFGMSGCWLLVNPDAIVPVPAVSGGMFWRDGGKTTLRWTPAPGMAGQSVFFQFLTLSPSGFLSSPGVELTVGTP